MPPELGTMNYGWVRSANRSLKVISCIWVRLSILRPVSKSGKYENSAIGFIQGVGPCLLLGGDPWIDTLLFGEIWMPGIELISSRKLSRKYLL